LPDARLHEHDVERNHEQGAHHCQSQQATRGYGDAVAPGLPA
jgi:hypothetical protein